MKKLHRMIIGAYWGPLLITSLIVLFILSMQFLWKYVDDLMGKGLPWHTLLKLMFYATASFVPLAIPLGVLLSSIMTLGAFGENSELPPMRSAGLGLFRIMRPLMLFVLCLAGFSFYFSNNLLPIANLRFQSLLYDVTRTKPALNLEPGVFYNGIEGFSIRAKEKNNDTGELGDVLIYDHRDPARGNSTVVHAQRGTMRRSTDGRFLVLTLENGTIHDERSATGKDAAQPLLRGRFQRDVVRLDLSGFGLDRTDEDLFRDHYKMLTLGQLQYAEDSLLTHYRARVADQEHYLRNGLAITRDSAVAPRAGRYQGMSTFTGGMKREQRDALFGTAQNMVRGHIHYIERTMEERQSRMGQLASFRIEWHRKLTLAVACLLMFFIGAPLGAIIRKGGMGLPTVFAIIFFLIFHIISYSSERLVKAGELNAWPGMWIGAAVLLPIGLWLSWTAATDSPLLDRDAYYRMIRKVTRLFTHADTATLQ